MILVGLIKTALLYPPILKEWIQRCLYMYNYMLTLVITGIIIYIIIIYIILRISKKKSEITRSIDEDGNNSNHSFLKSIWLIIVNKCRFIKYIIIGGVMVLFSWFFISLMFFSAGNEDTKGGDNSNIISGYTDYIASNSGIANDLVPTQFLQEHNTYLVYILGLCALYSLICFIWGGFFMTFSFGNKFVRNISIFFVILSILIVFIGKLLDFFVIR